MFCIVSADPVSLTTLGLPLVTQHLKLHIIIAPICQLLFNNIFISSTIAGTELGWKRKAWTASEVQPKWV